MRALRLLVGSSLPTNAMRPALGAPPRAEGIIF